MRRPSGFVPVGLDTSKRLLRPFSRMEIVPASEVVVSPDRQPFSVRQKEGSPLQAFLPKPDSLTVTFSAT